MSPIDPRRLQRHMRESHRQDAPATRIGSFTCYLHPEAPYETLNVAVPDESSEGTRVPIEGAAQRQDEDPLLALVHIKAHYASNRRVPRVEFLEECHPDLRALLEKAGYEQETRLPLLACTRASFAQARHPEGLRVEPLLPTSPWELARAYLLVQSDAYGVDSPLPEKAPPKHWEALGIDAGLLARYGDDEPAGAVGLTPLMDGLREVRGLAVRPDHRSRGVATFLLSSLARVAHETGAEALLAIPEDAQGVELAKRAGFVKAATLLSFRAEGAVAP